jgi:sugar phosphate isomerase/epimerase
MRFAVFTVSAPEYTPEEILGVLKALGYDGVEWRVIDQVESVNGQPGFWQGNRCTLPLRTLVEDAPRMRALTEAAGLDVANVGAYAACDDLPGVEQVLRGTALLGASSARVRLPRYDGSENYRVMRDRCLGQFGEVEALARLYGVKAVIETHQGMLTPSATSLAWFLESFDPTFVGALFDPGNMVIEGYEQYQMGLEALGPYLAHVQIKNAAWRPIGQRADGSTEWKAGWAPLRSGVVDVGAVFRALGAVGYDGWVAFEDFSTDVVVEDRLRDNLAYVRGVVAELSGSSVTSTGSTRDGRGG